MERQSQLQEMHSVTSYRTWESVFQTLVKAFRLQETILIFHNYSDNQEFPWKHQERINRVTNGTVRVCMGKNTQEMTQGKFC